MFIRSLVACSHFEQIDKFRSPSKPQAKDPHTLSPAPQPSCVNQMLVASSRQVYRVASLRCLSTPVRSHSVSLCSAISVRSFSFLHYPGQKLALSRQHPQPITMPKSQKRGGRSKSDGPAPRKRQRGGVAGIINSSLDCATCTKGKHLTLPANLHTHTQLPPLELLTASCRDVRWMPLMHSSSWTL